MKNRWFFKTFVLGLVGLLVSTFATPSQAGSTLVTTTASFVINAPAGTTATDFEFEFSPVDPISGLKIDSTNLPTPSISENPANTIVADFGASNAGFVNFSFLTSTPPSDVGVTLFFLTGLDHVVTDATLSVVVTANAVPEPASLALLGIGMTGFLAIRRFLKKPPVIT
jgi:hypothetical protein